MKNFLVILREPDGRSDIHTGIENNNHSQNWKQWLDTYAQKGHLAGGSKLTMQGKIVKGIDAHVSDSIHSVGTEIVGGFLLLVAQDLHEASAIVATCPVYEFGGYAEVRECAA